MSVRKHAVLIKSEPAIQASVAPQSLGPDPHTLHAPDIAQLATTSVCGSDNGCEAVAVESLPVTAATKRLLLVRTIPKQKAGNAADSTDNSDAAPDYWLVVVDTSSNVATHQYLVHGFKAEDVPDAESLKTTFKLSIADENQLTVDVYEPNPSNNAWGRRGFLRFTLLDLEAFEWEYQVLNYVNPLWRSTRHWNWRTRSGSSTHNHFLFNYVVPRVNVPQEFRVSEWQNADFSACASQLDKTTGVVRKGQKSPPLRVLALLDTEAELFLEILPTDMSPPSNTAAIQVCFAPALRFEPELPQVPVPPCFSFKLDGTHATSTVSLEKSPERSRYKLALPVDEDYGELGVTITLLDSRLGQSLSSSSYVPRSPQRLGVGLKLPKVRCDLSGNSLTPHIRLFDTNQTLLDNLQEEL